jgi:hypothetical protein
MMMMMIITDDDNNWWVTGYVWCMTVVHKFIYISDTNYFVSDVVNKKLHNPVKMAHVLTAGVQSHYSSHEQYVWNCSIFIGRSIPSNSKINYVTLFQNQLKLYNLCC